MLNIIATVVADGRFTTLINAFTRAGLVDTLSGSGPFTLFAPTDAAFSHLPPGLIGGWDRPDQLVSLTALLTLHIAARHLRAAELHHGLLIPTIHGQVLTVHRLGSVIQLNDATLLLTALSASNGLIYALDSVLLPQ